MTCLHLNFLKLSLFFLYSYHQLRYGEPTLRRAVPLALALISVSNPRLNILDTLSKFSHDADPEVSHNSIFAMGMVGSGKCGDRHSIEKYFRGRFPLGCSNVYWSTIGCRGCSLFSNTMELHCADVNTHLLMVRKLARVGYNIIG